MFFARIKVRTTVSWAIVAVALLVAGCATVTNIKDKIMGRSNTPVTADTIEYKSSGTRGSALEVPPPLSTLRDDDRTPANTASGLADAKGPVVSSDVLPKIADAQIRRSGNQRWLVVKATPETAWNIATQFWTSNGYALAVNQPSLGLMETDWLQSRAGVPTDFIRRTISNYADIFGTAQKRDKFRTRLEWGSEPGTVEIYVSHQGSEQVPKESAEKGSTSSETASIVWTPVRANAEVEAEMLARLAVAFGSAPPQGEPGTERSATASATGTPSSTSGPRARLERDNSGSGALVVDDLFDRAWRRVGLALDRGGFTVVDRDRSKGLYFVRYADPDLLTKKSDEGWLSKLAFWKSDDKPKPEQYRIVVNESGQKSTVLIQDPSGAPDRSANGQKILALLRDELK